MISLSNLAIAFSSCSLSAMAVQWRPSMDTKDGSQRRWKAFFIHLFLYKFKKIYTSCFAYAMASNGGHQEWCYKRLIRGKQMTSIAQLIKTSEYVCRGRLGSSLGCVSEWTYNLSLSLSFSLTHVKIHLVHEKYHHWKRGVGCLSQIRIIRGYIS